MRSFAIEIYTHKLTEIVTPVIEANGLGEIGTGNVKGGKDALLVTEESVQEGKASVLYQPVTSPRWLMPWTEPPRAGRSIVVTSPLRLTRKPSGGAESVKPPIGFTYSFCMLGRSA